ncbi:hypothetical protein PEC730217_37150 [Pectobacterium carotovorum subsp. carotovorum]|uniref:hypothetical protein n=1 Tax=Pectobacterium sp. HCp5_1 TaxID=3062446 RepID=UPI0020891B45|nr:hypothetical protein [Pectobacterium sp. HCp5_1]GKW34935.1 hypothetical protein PEC730217_37150 [Pectobacterium carotovorum subsp. carotovorum]
MTGLTNKRLNALSTMHGADSGILEEAIKEAAEMAREILSLRTQLATLEKQEPFAWTDAEELRDLAAHKCAYLYKIDTDNPYHDPRRQIMIYRGPVPQPVPNEIDTNKQAKDLLNRLFQGYPADPAEITQEVWNACRAAMLQLSSNPESGKGE